MQAASIDHRLFAFSTRPIATAIFSLDVARAEGFAGPLRRG